MVALAAALLLAGCRDERPVFAPSHDIHTANAGSERFRRSRVDLSYMCGNKFRVDNGNSVAATVTWEVLNTSPLEKGQLSLAARPGDAATYSTVTFTTVKRGTVRILHSGKEIERVANGGTACPTTPPPPPPAANPGRWGTLFDWRGIALHMAVLPTGKVMTWSHYAAPQVWDPANGSFTAVPSPALLFCAGQAFLPDGRLLVTGGHIANAEGLPDATLFNASTQTWTRGPAMRYGRWYPTSTTMPNGEVFTIAGTDQNGLNVRTPEVWMTSGGWRQLTGIDVAVPYYPRMHVAPNGLLFYAGDQQGTRYVNAAGTGSWGSVVANRVVADRRWGASVMYEPGKILYVGGGDPPTATAETIDLNSATPVWRATGSMGVPRRQHNAVILADGKVLVLGGSSGAGFSNEAAAVYSTEMWDPATGTWTTLASADRIPRVYHSTAVLLPSGRVLLSGNGDSGASSNQPNAQVYSPPYLLDANGADRPRPSITSAPATVAYGQSFTISATTSSPITKVTLVRLPSTTHGFDQNQRFNRLTFTAVTGGVSARAPASANLAPPGHYMLFVFDGSGVPSRARIIRIG
jgi:hypothetical protein